MLEDIRDNFTFRLSELGGGTYASTRQERASQRAISAATMGVKSASDKVQALLKLHSDQIEAAEGVRYVPCRFLTRIIADVVWNGGFEICDLPPTPTRTLRIGLGNRPVRLKPTLDHSIKSCDGQHRTCASHFLVFLLRPNLTSYVRMRFCLLLATLSVVGCGDDDSVCRSPNEATTFVESQTGNTIAGLASDDDYVYWSEANGPTIYRRPRLGGSVESLAMEDSTARDIVVDQSSVFWLTRDGAVRSLDKTTRAVREVLGPLPCPKQEGCKTSLRGTDDVLIRWSDADYKIVQIAKTDGATSPIASSVFAGAIAIDTQNVYWTDIDVPPQLAPISLRLMRIDRQGGQPELVATLGDALPLETKVDMGTAYVGALTRVEGIGQVFGIAPDGSVDQFVEGDVQTTTFAVDNGRIYYEAGASIQRATRGVSTPDTVACIDEAPLVMIASVGLYWGTRSLKRVDE